MTGRGRDLRALAAASSTLWERLAGGYAPIPGEESARLAGLRLERWREKAAAGDHELFRRRLSWLGITEEQALAALGEVRLAGELPPWLEVFSAALAAAAASAAAGRMERAQAPPFGAVLAPFVAAGAARLPAACRAVLSDAALATLEGDLLAQLSQLAAPALYLELSVRRARSGAAHGAAGNGSDGPPSATTLLDALTAEMLAGGLWDFFAEYPALARLLAGTVEQWVGHVAALAAALAEDLPAIHRVFGGEGAGRRPPRRAVSLRPSLSDRHDGGRTVCEVLLDEGTRLFYKPRDLGVEEGWFSLLGLLNRRAGCDLRLLRVLPAGAAGNLGPGRISGHGWAEAVRPTPCRDAAEGEGFYLRAGRLLAVLYALEASDCFYENVVASGGDPMLVDVETLMHPALRRAADLSPAEELADDVVFNSVFRAGFLPAWEATPEGVCVDISGLGARPGQVTPYLKRRWHDAGTDAMRLEHEPILVDSQDHLPQLDGVCLSAAAHTREVVTGFRGAYEALLALRSELAAPGGPLEELFGRREIRVVFHPTRIYGLLLKRLGSPRHLRSGVERSIETDVLSRFYLDDLAGSDAREDPQGRDDPERRKGRDGRAEEPWRRPVLAAELAALEQLDVPRFVTRAGSRDLILPGGGLVKDAFAETALARVRRKLAALGPADLALQTELVRASLSMAALTVRHEGAGELAGGAAGEAAGQAPRAPALELGAPAGGRAPAGGDLAGRFAAEAEVLAELIAGRAIVAPEGGATWIAPQLLPRASHYILRPLRLDLYNGLAGVALFFAALERTRGGGRKTALAALAPLRRFVAAAGPREMVREGYTLGGATGAGSFLYALARCAVLLDEPGLLASAARVVEQITPDWIAADDRFDVMSGAAGAVLGLLALLDGGEAHDRRARPPSGALEAARDKAVLCGDHLLAHRRPAGRGAAWVTGGGRCLTGFSHGAAGIALALLRLAHASGQERFAQAAAEAIAFEDGAFDEASGNWRDFRASAEGLPAAMNAWCHGAPGIGLARAAGLPLLDSPALRRDLQASLSAVARHGIGAKDGLCCGNLGRAELYLAAASVENEAARPRYGEKGSLDAGGNGAQGEDEGPPMRGRAVTLAAEVVARAQRDGGYRLSGRPGQDFFDPSFFQGLSGIGYELLRIAHPAELPAVLVWE